MYEPYYRYGNPPPQSPVRFLCTQMANMWMSMVGSVIQSFVGASPPSPPPGRWWDDRRYEHPSWPSQARFQAPRPASFSPAQWPWFQLVVMQPSTRAPAQVLMDLSPDSDLRDLKLLPLHDVENPQQSIRGTLERTEDRVLMLRLEFSEDASGTFYGSVFDRSRRRPCGYVRVTLKG
ncbi:hypothetical protein BO221_50695 [Archangium sp. Cb G35]|uniref:hypothetical protein n=1 Tax=Archangium sp. Cb G35 TaxID=1920190 RepID=UPI0009365AEA|nr:hypothetical protein [Archangium sp. Cb G35]OJT16293.1 hypothetical protein BO221_50695 [Archangium sp. Cb G35]